MIQGALIVNGYMRTNKFEEIKHLYEAASKKQGIALEVWYTDEMCYGMDGNHHPFLNKCIEDKDFILFLDKDILLARQLENLGIRVFNSARAIEVCDNKAMTLMAMSRSGVKTAKTLIAPLVFPGMYEVQEDRYIQKIEEQLSYPLVVKECYGSFGMQVYLVQNQDELLAVRRALADKPHLYQQFITSSIGKDVRIHVVGGEVVASMLRTNTGDFRANITNGGRMHQYEPDEYFKAVAIKVCEEVGLDFAGVDLMFGEKGEPILCEVNSNAHIKNILELTGINVAEKIMAYIAKEVTKDERVTHL